MWLRYRYCLMLPVALSACKGTEPTITDVPVALAKVSGDAQTATVGTSVTHPPTVHVADSRGASVAGVVVTFTVTQGGGTVTATVTTDAIGLASTGWQLGTIAGANTMKAAISASAIPPVTFTATADPGAPVAMTALAGDGQTAHAGTAVAVQPAVQLHDAFSNLVPGVNVTFAVTAGGGLVANTLVTTNANGSAATDWTLGTAGTNTLQASVAQTGVAGNPITFTGTALAAGTPTHAVVAAGDQQTGLIGFALNIPPAVRVLDATNGPVSGVAVTFGVTGGGGSVTGSSTTTDIFGVATVGSWTVQAGTNTLAATASGSGISGNPIPFTATGVTSSYNIDLRYLTTVSPSRKAVFDSAAARWERLIFGDIPDIPVNIAAKQCGSNAPALNETIDDIVIFVTLDSIDGPGEILGKSRVCFVRSQGVLPLIGIMRFDTADVATLENAGVFGTVILHEMAHVLGYGVIWGPPPFGLDLLASPAPAEGGGDPHFIGAQAIARFNASGGATYSAGAKVPVENCVGFQPGQCDASTSNGHWRESVFVQELMTGFLNSGTNPLSVISTASMGDLGYVVNYAASDPYTVTNPLAALRAPGGAVFELRDDIVHLPIGVVDAAGRIVQIILPR